MKKAQLFIGSLEFALEKAKKATENLNTVCIDGQDFWPSARKQKFLFKECTTETKALLITNFPVKIIGHLFNLVTESEIYIARPRQDYFIIPTPQLYITANCTLEELPPQSHLSFWLRFNVIDLNREGVLNV